MTNLAHRMGLRQNLNRAGRIVVSFTNLQMAVIYTKKPNIQGNNTILN